MQSEQNISLVRAINMIRGIKEHMFMQQIQQQQQDYAEQQQQQQSKLCGMQDYTRVSAGLCDMIYNTTLYGMQYQLLCYVVPVSTRSSTRSIRSTTYIYVLTIGYSTEQHQHMQQHSHITEQQGIGEEIEYHRYNKSCSN